MALTSQAIKNLKGGISQQPDILRFPNQGAKQINGWSSETQGLQKRPPSKFIRRMAASGEWGPNPLVHLVNRDAFEQYYMVFTGTNVLAVTLDGYPLVVRGYDGYADCPNPRSDLRLLTVADYTFAVNRTKTVKAADTLTHEMYPATNSRAIVAVRGGQYGRSLTVTVNSIQVAGYDLPSGVAEDQTQVPAMVAAMDAQAIAKKLTDQINTNTATHGFSAAMGEGFFVIYGNGTPITNLKTTDGYADQLINGFISSVQTFQKLPNAAPPGYLVEITGEATRAGDNYWVRYDATDKVWKETVKPGIKVGLDQLTMPRGLVRAPDGNFDWKVLDWVNRSAGDDETNPLPSFVDGKLNDVFFFRNRLGFLSGENVIMSRSARYFGFFPASVAVLSDDDPIDTAVSHSRVSILKYAVPFGEQLLLWSDQAQFVLTAQGTMSPKTVELSLTTEFDVQDTARPFGIGRGVYFSAPRASHASIKRYYAVQDTSDVKSSEDVSGHVPDYILNSVYNIHGSGTENFVTVLTNGQPERVYVYKFLYKDEQLAQQSWSHWEFGKDCKVLASACIGSFMYLVMDRHEGIIMERIEFTANTKDFPTEAYRTYIDGKVTHTVTEYDEDNNDCPVSLGALYGFYPHKDTIFWSVDAQGIARRHVAPEGGWEADPYIRFTGDQRHRAFAIGREYTFTYEFSKFILKQTAPDGSTVAEDSGRFQLRRAWVNYEQSGSFTISVNNGLRQWDYVMSGGVIGGDIRLGLLTIGNGQHRFAVTGNATKQTVTLHSNTPQPVNVIGCGFEGLYVRRSVGA